MLQYTTGKSGIVVHKIVNPEAQACFERMTSLNHKLYSFSVASIEDLRIVILTGGMPASTQLVSSDLTFTQDITDGTWK